MLRPQQPIVFIGAGLLFGFSGLVSFGRELRIRAAATRGGCSALHVRDLARFPRSLERPEPPQPPLALPDRKRGRHGVSASQEVRPRAQGRAAEGGQPADAEEESSADENDRLLGP